MIKEWLSIFLVFLLIVIGFIGSVESEYVSKDTNKTNNDESRVYVTGLIKNYDENGHLVSNPVEVTGNAPTNWDWRSATYNGRTGDWTTPIRDQAYCGSCWAFAVVASLESVYNIKNNIPNLDIDLSEQFILSCSKNYGYRVGDCCGGYFQGALNFVKDVGVTSEACFDYVAIDAGGRDAGDCRGFRIPSNNKEECSEKCDEWQSYIIKVSSYNSVVGKDSIKDAIYTYGPVIAAFDVYTDFPGYTGGIYEKSPGSRYSSGHVIVIVGYNDDQDYWICKNSWGADWGENGFFKIAFGECGIGSAGSTVYIDGYNKRPLSMMRLNYQNLIQQFPVFRYLLSIMNSGY